MWTVATERRDGDATTGTVAMTPAAGAFAECPEPEGLDGFVDARGRARGQVLDADALQRAAARLALDPGWSSFGGDAALDAMAAEVSDVAVRAHPIFGEQDPPVPDGEVDKAAGLFVDRGVRGGC